MADNADINQLIQLLVNVGNLDQVRDLLESLRELKAAQADVNSSAGTSASAQKKVADAVYDVGHSYELLVEEITRASTAAQKNASGATWASKQQQDVGELLQELAVYEARADALTATELRNYQVIATAATKAGVAVRGSHEESLRSARGTTQAVLEVSRGLEDFATGGFVGILNNIPGAIQGIGQAAGLSSLAVGGLTAGISVLATGAFVLWKNWNQVEELFGLGIPRPILDGTEELKNKLKEAKDVTEELGKKSNLTFAELNQYKDATGKVREYNEELKKRKELEDILSGKSKAERERASAFKEAVAETGGEEAVRSLEGAISPSADGRGLVFNQVRGKNSTPRELAEDMIREAGGGDKRIRDEIADLLGKAYRPAEGSFASNIAKTAPETKEAAKAKEDADKLRVKAQGEFRKVIEDDAKDYARTDPNLTGKSRDKELNEQIELAEKHVQQKTRDFEEAGRDRKAALTAAAQTYGPGIEGALGDTFTRHVAGGRTAQQSVDKLLPQVRDSLRQVGAPADLVDDLAAQILKKATDKAANEIRRLQLERGLPAQQAAQNLRLTDVRKVAGAEGREQKFNDQQALAGPFLQAGMNQAQAAKAASQAAGLVQNGADPSAAVRQVFAAFIRHAQATNGAMLRIQSDAELAAGQIGRATLGVAQLQSQARRNQQRRRSLMPQ